MTHEYGTTGVSKYGLVDCHHCDKKNIKIEIMGNHLLKCHTSELVKNFQAYSKIPNYEKPLVNTTDKTYSFCFACKKYYKTNADGVPSKCAIKHMNTCPMVVQIAALKNFLISSLKEPLSEEEDVITLPKEPKSPKNIIINPHECPVHSAEIAQLRAEIQKIKNDLLEFMKHNSPPPLLIQELPEACGDCKEWGSAYSNKENEIADLREKLGLN